jgi:hypothetical protein
MLLGILGAAPNLSATTHTSQRLPFEDSPFGFHPADVPLDISRYPFGPASEIGVRWHRPTVYAFWFRVKSSDEKTSAGFRWDKTDATAARLPPGMHILWNLSARGQTVSGSWLPRDPKAYCDYVRAVVERYDGDGRGDAPGSPIIRFWQIDNEPNLVRQGTPQQYAQVVRMTYEAAREASENCRIVLGGVGGGPAPAGPGSAIEDFRRFYVPLLRDLDGRGFDIFDFHWYGGATGDYRRFGDVYREVRDTLDRFGFRRAEIWVTEMSSYSGRPRGMPFQTEEQQAADLVKRYVYPLSLGVKKVFWAFGLVEGFGAPDNDYFDNTGLIFDGVGPADRGRGVRKLAYFAYQIMTEKLEGSDWKHIETLNLGIPHIYAYQFRRRDDPQRLTIAVWWDRFEEPREGRPETRTVELHLDGKTVEVTSALTDEQGQRQTQILRPDAGVVRLSLDAAPLFVQFESLSKTTGTKEELAKRVARASCRRYVQHPTLSKYVFSQLLHVECVQLAAAFGSQSVF